jgi:hypothetical protein
MSNFPIEPDKPKVRVPTDVTRDLLEQVELKVSPKDRKMPKLKPTDYAGALLDELGKPLTRENYLNVSNVKEGELDGEQESMLPDYARLPYFRKDPHF